MEATTYSVKCIGCGALEEKRVEGEDAPVFNLFPVRTVIEAGARVPRAECPLCGSRCATSAHPSP